MSTTRRSTTPPQDRTSGSTRRQFSAPVPAWLGGPNQGFGNARKDAIVGPGRVNFTTSLYKSFAMTERAHFELRFESFNTFNHTQFNSVRRQTRRQPVRPDHQRVGSPRAGTGRQVHLLRGWTCSCERLGTGLSWSPVVQILSPRPIQILLKLNRLLSLSRRECRSSLRRAFSSLLGIRVFLRWSCAP